VIHAAKMPLWLSLAVLTPISGSIQAHPRKELKKRTLFSDSVVVNSIREDRMT